MSANLPAKRNHFLFWFLFICVCASYFTIKHASPGLIAQLYNQESWEALNRAAVVSQNQSLEYYLGTIEDNLFGPLCSVLSGIAFILLGLKFLKTASHKKFAAFTFLFLLITKFEILFFPPYGDPVTGAWPEAVWLARHNFNYFELFQQAEYAHGGPKVYFFSLYPGFLALLIKLIPSTKAFLAINHLMTFAMSAVIVALFRGILLKITDHSIAFLSAALLLFLPLVQSQTEMINMEVPCLLFFMLAAYNLVYPNLSRAGIKAIICALVKPTGIIACGMVSIVGFFMYAFNPTHRRLRNLFWILLPTLFALTLVYLKGFINPQPLAHNAIGFLIGWKNIVWLKVILPSLTGSAGIIILTFIIQKFRKKDCKTVHTALIMLTGAALWFLLYLNFSVLGPRYKLLISPFLLYSVIFSFMTIIPFRIVTKISLIAAIIVAGASSHGFLYRNRIPSEYYAYVLIDRSLEYRNDLKLHTQMAKELEQNFPGFTIGAPFATAQMLALPEYGYVQKSLKVVLYGMPITYGGIRPFSGLSNLDVRKTVWIAYQDNGKKRFPYPIDPQDKVLKDIVVGNRKATLFMGGVAIEKMRVLVGMYQAGLLGTN